MRRQNNQAARGLHGVAVFYQGVEGAGRDQQVGEFAVVELQLIGFTCRHGHRAARLRHHHTLVADFGRQKGNVAIQPGGQVALVQDGAGSTVAAKAVFAV